MGGGGGVYTLIHTKVLMTNKRWHVQGAKSLWDSATPWTVAFQALLSMGFSRKGYQSGLPCSPSGDLPDPGIKPISLTSPALAGGFFTTSATWEAQ